jgi:hypothetical protein
MVVMEKLLAYETGLKIALVSKATIEGSQAGTEVLAF